MHDAQRASRRRRLPETRTLVLTVGHSTHSVEAFIGLLQAHGIKLFVDVRSFPRSHLFHEKPFDKSRRDRY
jgi:uncharacterized protein (DUF488 family)